MPKPRYKAIAIRAFWVLERDRHLQENEALMRRMYEPRPPLPVTGPRKVEDSKTTVWILPAEY